MHGSQGIRGFGFVALVGLLGAAALAAWGRMDEPAGGAAESAARVVEPVAPVLPSDVVAALQEGKYDTAIAGLRKLADEPKTGADDRAYLKMVEGIALRLKRDLAGSRKALDEALKASPEGVWATKVRFELATTELVAGRPEMAEPLAQAQVEQLLSGERKDKLAGVFRDFAEQLLKPATPTTPADPRGARDLLAQAREVAKTPAYRARLLFEMGRAAQQAADPGLAIGDYQAYLAEAPKGADAIAAKFYLGEMQLATGQLLPARLTWSDLARESATDESPGAKEFRPKAMYLIAHTYGAPNPPDDTSLNLAVAALKRYLEAYPRHTWNVRAWELMGLCYQARGQGDKALEALRTIVSGQGLEAVDDEAKKDLARISMASAYMIGAILQGQEKYDAAIEAFQAYLKRYPDGPQSAEAQRQILNTQLMVADRHEREKRYEAAREAWRTFVAVNPLDGRVPELLYRIGASFGAEKKYDEAVAAWETLEGKFPGTEPAGHAQFDIARVTEEEKGDAATAIERYRKVAVEPWQSQARQRIAAMEGRELTVVTPRAFRSGETPVLEITTRNLEKLTFTAYRLNVEAYFRKKLGLESVENLDIGLVAPDAEWEVEVPGYGKYKPIKHTYEMPKVPVPGVFVVKVTDQKTLQATTLVMGSDIEAIVTSSNQELIAYVQDMKTGAGRSGARVIFAALSDTQEPSEIVFEGKTGPDGVLQAKFKRPLQPGEVSTFLVIDGEHAAGSSLGLPETVAQGLSARAYMYTDRPAYRPGQPVSLRGVVREVKAGRYDPNAGATYRLEVADARGRRIVSRDVKLSEFGTFAENFAIDSGAPVGVYGVRLYQPGKSEFSSSFQVQAYQLQKLDVAIELPRTVYFRGEKVEGKAVATYQYGGVAAGRPIVVQLPDGRTLTGSTDATGEYAFSFETEGFAEEQTLSVAAQLPEDGVGTAAAVAVVIRAFRIDVSTPRDVYVDGETFRLNVTTLDALGEPTGQTLRVSALKRLEQDGRVTERETLTRELKTDAKTGKGTVDLAIEDKDGGSYVLRVSGTDRFGNPVVEQRVVTISGKEDEEKLRFLTDRTRFQVGEGAEVRLFNRAGAGTAIVTWEADRILRYQIVKLAEGDNRVAWEVDGDQFPNLTLHAAQMAGQKFYEATVDLTFERELKVSVSTSKPTVGPGDEVEVTVTTRDQLDRPVAAELSIALVDKALLRLYQDRQGPIGSFFYGQTRTGAFATQSTNTFTYEPSTQPVAEALVEERDRESIAIADALAVAEVKGQLREEVALNQAAPREMAAEAPAPMMDSAAAGGVEGRSAGGMGGGGMMGTLAEKPGADDMFGRGARAKQSMLGYAMGAEMLARKVEAGQSDGERGEQFVETAYWNPSVATNSDGTAKVKFRAPGALSKYEFSVRGTTGADTLVGQTTGELVVSKDFFVELKAPASLTEGDKPRFAGRLHHRGVKGKATLRLTVYAGGREQVFPKEIELKGDGVEELLFDPCEIPDGDSVRLTLAARAEGVADEVTSEVPSRSWGVPVYATASGLASDDRTAFLELPGGRQFEQPEMVIELAPSTKRMLVELALGEVVRPLDYAVSLRCFPPPTNTVADRASELLGVMAAVEYLVSTKETEAPDFARLRRRAESLASELVALQNDDGGWPWVAPQAGSTLPSVATTSARVVWALARVKAAGLLPDPGTVERGTTNLTQEFAKADASDYDSRSAILHGLSSAGAATFEQANSLNRVRNTLSDQALAYLALALVNLERRPLAQEAVGVLVPRSKAVASVPGGPLLRSWGGEATNPAARGAVEATALAALAIGRATPEAAELKQAIDWLLAERNGLGWNPSRARGAALAALGLYEGRAQRADDAYRLVVTVNDTEVYRAEVKGGQESGDRAGRLIRVPLKALQPQGRNRVRFDIEGRGTYGYSVSLTGFARDFGPDQDRNNRPFVLHRRVYLAAEKTLDGKPLPSGFGVALNAQGFENPVSQVALGGRAKVSIDAWRNESSTLPAWQRDSVVVEEYLPAGVTVVEGSIVSQADLVERGDGVIRFYFGPEKYPGGINYEVYGYLPGNYRSLPARIVSASDPGRSHLGDPGALEVKGPGEATTDPYRATPDELYARGKALVAKGMLVEAAEPFEALWSSYTLRDDIAKDVARLLLSIHIKANNPRKIVEYFEVLREKSPEVVIPFDEIRAVGRAYRDIDEFERAYLVWQAIAEASYLEDARVGEVLRQRGKTFEGLAFLLDLWRSYPESASIGSDFFGLAQYVGRLAIDSETDPALRAQRLRAGITKPALLQQSVRLIQTFLALEPTSPLADEASLALVNAFLELEDSESVVKLSQRFAGLYPKSKFLDSFQYSEALGRFQRGEYDRAIAVAEAIAKATYKDAAGAEVPSPNKLQALFILGQIHDARRQPAKALEYYQQVAEQFTDAASAVASLTRKSLRLPELTVIRPEGSGVKPAAVAVEPSRTAVISDRPEVTLGYRNVAEADVKVYPVDLMRLYLERRNLDAIAGIDLAGITPLVERSEKLGDGQDFADKARSIPMPLKDDGAYLVMVRGDQLYASGIALVSPLELEVLEEPQAGRVRVTVRDAKTGDLVPKVQVRVIGSGNGKFLSGETDLRGVYVAEGVQGVATAVVRRGTNQYAFYRGTTSLGAPPAAPTGAPTDAPGQPQSQGQQSLEQNLRLENGANQMRAIERLQQRYNMPATPGVQVEKAY